MLAELRVHAASRRDTPPRFRPYLAEAVRSWSTGLRQSRAWAPHVVLGAGPLFELPLESLARTFARVVLVDRAHLSAIRPRLARYGNIERQWRDLSPATSVDPLAFLAGIADLDWVISANLLGSMALAAPAGQHRQVIEDHLAALAALPCPATLITDLDYRVFNRHGVVLDSADLMHGRFMPRSGLRWKWEAAPFGADQRHTRRVHSVAAWPDWREADFG